MRKSKSVKIYGLIFLIFVVINVLFFLQRNTQSFSYKEKSDYYQLYFQDDKPRITNLNYNNDTLRITILPQVLNSWTIEKNTGEKSTCLNNNIPLILTKGSNLFKLISNKQPLDTFRLTIDRHDKQNYVDYDEGINNDIIEVSFSTLPIITKSLLPVHIWKNNYTYIDPSEIEEVKKILTNKIGITKNDRDTTKVKKIVTFLLDKLDNKRGVPDNSMLASTPYQQYKKAINNKSKIWCGNFSHIYSFFANSAGIITRQVGVGGSLGTVLTSAHSFNESYISELNAWAFIDLNSSKAFTFTQAFQPLNTLDIYQLKKMGHFNNIFVYYYEQEKLIKKPYKKVNQSEIRYFKHNVTFTYHLPTSYEMYYSGNTNYMGKIINYIIPRKVGFIYSENSGEDYILYYLKYFFLYSNIFLGFLYLRVLIHYLTKPKLH
jgi:hypothetical protein